MRRTLQAPAPAGSMFTPVDPRAGGHDPVESVVPPMTGGWIDPVTVGVILSVEAWAKALSGLDDQAVEAEIESQAPGLMEMIAGLEED